ncbi:unnamed protein product [Dicrocoelium dendriticum]|nr:unnamed protein product [Dicrocoelium dendriticum]
MGSEAEKCLSVIKRFLRCPVCLDDFRNPLYTPCTHVFCKFCIYEHLGGKKQAKCPLCNREFTRRSLKTSIKFTNIAKACEDIIKSYEKEKGTPVLPSNIPSEHLHLSQEMTQCVVVMGSDLIAPSDRSPPAPKLKTKNRPPLVPASKDESVPRSSRSRILLGTSARKRKKSQQSPTKAISTSTLDDNLSTEPMVCTKPKLDYSCGVTLNLMNKDPLDLDDLFTSTQLTQPMNDSSDKLTVVVDGDSAARMQPPRTRAPRASIRLQGGSAVCAASGVSSLPPLPPAALGHPIKSQRIRSHKRVTDSTLSDMPPKISREDTDAVSTISDHGLLKKTHEVLCRVQPSREGNDGGHVSDNRVTARRLSSVKTETQISQLKRRPSTSYSIRSWPSKRQRTPCSVDTRNRLLQKYRVTRPSLLSSNPLLRHHSLKSPGWSRWRAMCREFRRRSSLRLSFRRKSASVVHFSTPENIKLCSSDRITCKSATRSGANETLRARIPRCTIDNSKHTFPIPDEESHRTGSVSEHFLIATSHFRERSKPCRFMLPLSRLISRSRSRSSIPLCMEPLVRSTNSDPMGDTGRQLSVSNGPSEPTITHSPCQIEQIVGNNDATFHIEDLFRIQHVHCGACGEMLVFDPDYLSFTSNSHLNAAGSTELAISRPSHPLSSTYWHAEDPGDTILLDASLDRLVRANRSSAFPDFPKKLVDASCQTSLNTCTHSTAVDGPVSTTYSAAPPVTEVPDGLASRLSPIAAAVPSTVGPVRSHTDPVASTANPIQLSLSSPVASTMLSSAYQTSGSELMPTVDRERLRNECNELEAVVAALQQQLEAEAGQLSPNTTAELLRAAGTEPIDDEELAVHHSILVCCDVENHNSPASGVADKDASLSESVQDRLSTQAPADIIAPHHSAQEELTPPPQTVETCTPDAVDVIPSSQVEDEQDPAAPLPTAPDGSQHSLENHAIYSQSDNQIHVRRVEASQPPSSLSMVPGEDFIPASVDSQPLLQMSRLPKPSGTLTTELTQCPESYLDSQMTCPNNISATLERIRVHSSVVAVTGSNLNGNDVAMLRSFCRRFGVSEHSRFVPQQTTHVVMKAEPDRPRVVKRTLKYFMGILGRAWIVNTDWIRDCLAADRVLNEAPYEIEGDTVCGDCHEGPRRGRLNVPAQPQSSHRNTTSDTTNCGPFSGLWFCAFGSLGLLSLSEFMNLAADGGAARVFEDPAELSASVDNYLKHEAVGGQRPRAVLLTNHSPPDFDLRKCQEVYRKYGFPIISVDWMLNCISLYRRIPINEGYRICPSSKTSTMSSSS